MYPSYNPNARYSPSAPTDAYSSSPNPNPPPNPTRPPYGFPPPPTLPSFRPYDAYASHPPPRPPFPYHQPRPTNTSEAYDPYRPSSSSAYDPGRPSIGASTSYPVSRPPSYPTPSIASTRDRASDTRPAGTQELTVLTPPVTVNIEGHSTIVHSLPPSQLPLTKYIPVNRDDALELHRHLTTREASVWYADGSNRAGEGWSAAVEWKFASGQSGSKMRGCVGLGDALDAELGGIYKAVEGFQELLRISLKDASPMPHHLIVFCDSQAAIVGIDTCSRPEAAKFDLLWREICTEFILAHLTLVWLPRDNVIEGHVLADKIAVVGASNAYLKKKKDGVLPDIYRRPGGGEPSAPGSTHPGDWQRGDAEPGLRRPPFERPVIRQVSPFKPDAGTADTARPKDQSAAKEHAPVGAVPEVEEEIPREGSIFVTHFPEEASAKDLGILFSQFGSIESVDIYHVSPTHPRLAYVSFLEGHAGPAAIEALHRKAVRIDTPFAISNAVDFDVWRDWTGTLTVVMAEPPLLVPTAVLADFPNLPDWAKRGAQDHAQQLSLPTGSERKRDRTLSSGTEPIVAASLPDLTPLSPRKRTRTGSDSIDHTAADDAPPAHADNNAGRPVHIADVTGNLANDLAHQASNGPVTPSSSALRPDGKVADASSRDAISSTSQRYASAALPPTPMTAERPVVAGDLQAHNRPSNDVAGESKPRLTNSAAEPQEQPIRLSAKTLRGLIDLVRDVFTKHESNNWIAHSCLIAFELDQARRALQGDLYATDEAFLAGREHERILADRGFTPQRVDAFITKVLKVLDGIAAAEDEASGETDTPQSLEALQATLDEALATYPFETKEAVDSAGRLMEYLLRGKDLQEKKRLDIERRVKVLEGMVKVGEVVGGVVRFLLTEDN